MTLMIRALVLATILSAIPRTAAVQVVSVLHIKVILVDAEGRATPVPRHALLVSDNPATVTPRRIVTALDGTVDVETTRWSRTSRSRFTARPINGRRPWTSPRGVTRSWS